jgi:transposase
LSRRLLPLIPAGLSVVQVLPTPDCVTIVTRPIATRSACPICGILSGRVHSHYTRSLADLPWQGRVAAVRLQARRFRCVNPDCSRLVFTERLPEVARPWARRSDRLADVQRHLGLALGGVAGSRLADRLAMPVSGATLLRLLARTEVPVPPPPRVIGLDEWAWRRGLTYGTILYDLERGKVVDLLPDRKAETVEAWLKQHPSVEVIARDRASVFGRAIREGAPAAVEVGDRWHLLRNLGDALRAAVGRHRGAVTAALASLIPEAEAGQPPPRVVGTTGPALEALRQQRRDERHARYAAMHRLHEEGVPPRLIAPVVGMSQRTIERWLAAGGAPEHRRPPVSSMLDPFRPYLEQRWEAGCRKVAELCREIREQGFAGSFQTVARWAAERRVVLLPDPATVTARSAAVRRPSRRRCAWLLGCEPDKISAAERDVVRRITAAAPALGIAADLARRFAAMLRGGDAADLDAWLASARQSELASLAEGIGRDLAAVRAAITESWSTSPVEGEINRVKTVKRQMYGRAGHALLRVRVLAA